MRNRKRTDKGPLCLAYKHGMYGTRTYEAWHGLKQRCLNPNDHHWLNYGGRGITVCDRWRDDFLAFLADMGECPDGLQIDRIDVNGPYSPDNCRWVDFETQMNNRTTSLLLTVDGVTLTSAQWSRKTGVRGTLIRNRISRGWDHKSAVTLAPRVRNRWNQSEVKAA